MRKYCEECGKEVETKIVIKKETYDVCGEAVEVDAQVLVCAECGEEFFCEELDNATLVLAYNKYRRRHKLLLPEEIRKIREQYGLSQRSFAKLLNWGDKTICRYENGSIQAVVGQLEQNEEYRTGRRFFHLFFAKAPCEENGYRAFDYDKFCAMVLFFAHKNTELLKTKLMKLLNYSDMIFYKENGISISGARYAHLPYGPVPENFDILLGTMAADHIARIEVVYDNGYEKHQVIAEEDIPEDVLSKEELAVLNRIYNKFACFGSVDISNYSHKEKGYMETQKGEIISYAYAKYIELN